MCFALLRHLNEVVVVSLSWIDVYIWFVTESETSDGQLNIGSKCKHTLTNILNVITHKNPKTNINAVKHYQEFIIALISLLAQQSSM